MSHQETLDSQEEKLLLGQNLDEFQGTKVVALEVAAKESQNINECLIDE